MLSNLKLEAKLLWKSHRLLIVLLLALGLVSLAYLSASLSSHLIAKDFHYEFKDWKEILVSK